MNKEKGKFGELAAEKYLVRKGFKVVAKNYHSRYGEIDIIASSEDCMVFVEVKLRKRGFFCSGREAVSNSKRKRILKTALTFLSKTRGNFNTRFDVIEIQNIENANGGAINDVVHLENAFTLNDIYNAA